MQGCAELSIAHVWRVSDLATEEAVFPSGHALLDAQLPGGGWPVGGLVELLQARPEAHVWQLVLPALVAACGERDGPIVLVGPPHQPFGPALQAQGLPADRLLWIRCDQPSARLWAAEQALRCADVIGMLAWLPKVRSQELRRLHLAARRHRKLLFAMREASAVRQASPAPLRIQIDGVDEMQLRLVKRKGPPLDHSLVLAALPERVRALLASRRGSTQPLPVPAIERRSHVLDRLVTES